MRGLPYGRARASTGGGPMPCRRRSARVFATNITPDAETGIGTWSRAAFDRAMRRGIARNGEHLYPAFPYDHFTRVSDGELEALYAWLMTRPPIAGPCAGDAARRCVRLPAADCRLEPALSARRGPCRPIRRDRPTGIAAALWPRAWRIAAAAIRRATVLGAEDKARAYDGAMVEGWYAPPLNARSPAVRPWTVDRLHVYLRTGLSPAHAAAAGPMGDVTRALVRGARRGRARDRRLLRLPDVAGARGPTGQARTDGSAGGRATGASRGGDPVRRRLRGLSRARRADDAAGPAAAGLGHAAPGGQCAQRGAHHHGRTHLARPARPDRRCRPSPTCSTTASSAN